MSEIPAREDFGPPDQRALDDADRVWNRAEKAACQDVPGGRAWAVAARENYFAISRNSA